MKLAATAVTIALALTVPSVAAAGSISGEARDSESYSALADICVQATPTASSTGTPGSAQTGADGQFTISGLATGEYRLSFSDCRPNPEYSPYEFDETLGVPGDHNSCCWVGRMRHFGAISGKAFDFYRNPIAGGLCAEALDENGVLKGRAETRSDGTYVIDRLPAGGPYHVHFVDCSTPAHWDSQWYRHDYRPYPGTTETIEPVGVTPWQTTTGIDANYVRAIPAIKGTITEEETGAPIADYCARIWAGDRYMPGMWKSDAAGHYRVERDEFGALSPGWYQIQFARCGMGGPWLDEWYGDSYTQAGSPGVLVPEGGSATADAVLSRGASISGTVTLHDTQPSGLVGVCVLAFPLAGGGTGAAAGATDVFKDGAYVIEGLPGGDFKVRFARCLDSPKIPRWQTEWWDGAATFDPARTISVAPGGTFPGVDATLELGPDAPAAPRPVASVSTDRCVVPRLHGLTIARAKLRLRTAGCRLGTVSRVRAKGRRGRVLGTTARAGRNLLIGARVAVRVAR